MSGTGAPDDGAGNVRVRHDTAAARFEILVDDVVAGYADHQDRTDGVRVFPHAVVATEFGGRGLAGRLIAEALRVTSEEGLNVLPACSFVDRYIQKNPGSATLA